MKKAITIIIGFFAVMCFSTSVYATAATWAQAAAGGGLTVGSTGATGDFTFEPSPGVLIGGASDLTVYCILAGNSKAGVDAIVYNMWSGGGQVAQMAVDLSATDADVDDLGAPTDDGTKVDDFLTK